MPTTDLPEPAPCAAVPPRAGGCCPWTREVPPFCTAPFSLLNENSSPGSGGSPRAGTACCSHSKQGSSTRHRRAAADGVIGVLATAALVRGCADPSGDAQSKVLLFFLFFFGFSLAHTHARHRWGRGGPGCADLLEEIQLQTRSPSQQFRSFSYVAGALLVLATQIASFPRAPTKKAAKQSPNQLQPTRGSQNQGERQHEPLSPSTSKIRGRRQPITPTH